MDVVQTITGRGARIGVRGQMGRASLLTELDKGIDQITAAMTASGKPMAVTEADVRGVKLKIFEHAPPSLREYLEHYLLASGQKEFLVHGEERLSFAEVHAQSVKVAAMLQHHFGIAKGDRVAIAMRNYPEWISCFAGAIRIGAIVVPMNAWWTGEELGYGLANSGARLLIADEERLQRVASLGGPKIMSLAVRTGPAVALELGVITLEDALAESPDEPWYLPPIGPEDDATILYTSGSTGPPKGAVSTHGAVVTAALGYYTHGLVMQELARHVGIPLPEQPIMLLNLPLFHTTGLVPVALVSMALGRKLVMMRKWDAGEALRLIEAEGVTYFIGVPTMSLEMMQHPDRERYDLSTLVDIAAGGGPRPAEHVERLAEAFKGQHPAIGYGLTETNAAGASNFRDNYRHRPASTGRPSKPVVEMMIADEQMHPLPVGEVGEICIRSATNVRGYWMNPKATAASFTPDGWFRSGDLGRMDEDDYLTIVDRKKDIIIRGGENVSAVEVESAIYSHPAIAEACVFGLPDERLGEVVGAVVSLKSGETLEPDALIGHVRRELAAFKVPAKLWIGDEPMPKLGSGKIDKVRIKTHFRALLDEGAP